MPIAALGLGLLWQALAMVVRRPILPTAVVVLQTFWVALQHDLGPHLSASLWRVVASIALAVGTAARLGVMLGQSGRLNRFAELFATRYGLRYYIFLNSSSLMDYPAMHAGILALSLLGLGLTFGIDWLQRRLCPYLPAKELGDRP